MLGVAALSGCSPLMQGAAGTLRLAFAPPASLVVDRADVMQRPRYQLRIDSPFGSALMILAQVEGHSQYWVTSSHQVLVIEHGFIRRVTGFPENLEGTRFLPQGSEPADPFAAGLHRIQTPRGAVREIDWMPGYRYGVRVESTFQRVGVEEHDILGERRRLLRIDETYRTAGTDFAGVNRYWVDPDDGFVFISEQTLMPKLTLRLTQLRPYREGSAR